MGSSNSRPTIGGSLRHRPPGGHGGRRRRGSNHPLLHGGSLIGRLGGSSSAASESITAAVCRDLSPSPRMAFGRLELGFPWQLPQDTHASSSYMKQNVAF